MSTDLQPVEEFVSPATGEVLTLASPTPDLAGYLADIRDLESRIREHKRVVTGELLARLDRNAAWTEHLSGGLKISSPSPAPVEEFDELALREELLQCVDRGELSIEAVDRAVETIVTYKARKTGINAIRKISPEMEQLVNGYRRMVEKDRRVTVTRSGT